jgi:hypothetical protein
MRSLLSGSFVSGTATTKLNSIFLVELDTNYGDLHSRGLDNNSVVPENAKKSGVRQLGGGTSDTTAGTRRWELKPPEDFALTSCNSDRSQLSEARLSVGPWQHCLLL